MKHRGCVLSSKYSGAYYSDAGPSWADVEAALAHMEAEHGLTIFLHMWRNPTPWRRGVMMCRLDATKPGAGYRGKPRYHVEMLWPNGRNKTLAAAVLRLTYDLAEAIAARPSLGD